MRTPQDLIDSAQRMLDETPVSDTVALIRAVEYLEAMQLHAEMMNYCPKVEPK